MKVQSYNLGMPFPSKTDFYRKMFGGGGRGVISHQKFTLLISVEVQKVEIETCMQGYISELYGGL